MQGIDYHLQMPDVTLYVLGLSAFIILVLFVAFNKSSKAKQ